MKEKIQGKDITLHYSAGCDLISLEKTDQTQFAEAIEMAQKSDVAILVLGDPMEWNGEQRDRANLSLTKPQKRLLQAVKSTGTPTILVLVCGRPQGITWAYENIPSILVGFNPGQYGGLAIASVLFGDYNPSGRLSFSWPRHSGQIPVYYNQLPGWHAKEYIDMAGEAQWPFGYGLNYTKHTYNEYTIAKNEYRIGEKIEIKVQLENHGDREGIEVVQVYVRDLISSYTVPVIQLKSFARVTLEPHEKKEVLLEVETNNLGLIHEDLNYIIEEGEFLIGIGPNSRDLCERFN